MEFRTEMVCRALVVAVGLFLVPAELIGQEETSTPGSNPSGMVLFREHAEAYKGGEVLTVRIRYRASTWDGLTAVGLYEKAPAGWTLVGLQSVGGPAPSVAPEAGASGLLQFIWITPPRVPVTLQYQLQIPPKDSGVRTFSGQVEYRLGAGKLVSNVALSQLDGVADESPVVTLRGSPVMTLTVGDAFVDPGATATDKEDGDLTAQIQVAGRVETSRAGRYELVYSVVDRVGNRAEPVQRTVTVRAATDSAPGEGGADGGGPVGGGEAPFLPRDGIDRATAAAPEAGAPSLFPNDWLAELQRAPTPNEPRYDIPMKEPEENGPEQENRATAIGRTAGLETGAPVPAAGSAVAGSMAPDGTPATEMGGSDSREGASRLVLLALTFLGLGLLAWYAVLRGGAPRWRARH